MAESFDAVGFNYEEAVEPDKTHLVVPQEEEDEEDDEIEDYECEEEEEYSFRFKEGENPLEFVEDNALSGQPYKQFERLEYEALAQRKRKALSNNTHSEGLAKKARVEEASRATMEELMKSMNYGARRKSREPRKRGRQKGSRNKPNREVVQKLGEATLYYAHGRYEEAISVLHQIVLKAPHLPDAYHTLGLVHTAMGDNERALGLYMLAAHLMPKDSSLWKLLVSWSTEKGDIDQANYCLSKAITADPKDIQLRLLRASLYLELRDDQKAAESYDQIHQLCPENVEALKTGAKLYKRCGQLERAIQILEDYLNNHPTEADLSVIDLLASLLMEINEHSKALSHIEKALLVYCSGKQLPFNLTAKAGICHVHLGNMQKAEMLFGVLEEKNAAPHFHLVLEVADTLMDLGHYDFALKYYLMLEGIPGGDKGFLHLKIARCNVSMKDRLQAILFFKKALETLPDNIDARLTLASLLVEESKDDEAISLLSPPINLDVTDQHSHKSKPWWLNGRVKLKIGHIYRAKGMLEDFVDAIFPLVRESLYCCESQKQKVKVKRRLKRRVLNERVKVLQTRGPDNLFHGFRPVTSSSDLVKAARAKKLLQKKEEQKAKAVAAGVDWQSDDGSDDEPLLREPREAPLPNILKDEEHYLLVVNLCKALATLRRYSDALEIISLTLRLANSILPAEKKEFRILGAQLAYNIMEPKHGFDYVKYIVQQHPYSIATWNCYYKVISRLENRDTRHYKFLQSMQGKLKDCVPPILISAHHFTIASHHQDAARKYLEAYKLLPDSPLINLCVGSALINLALGFRLQNKHQCVAQGLAFLHNNSRLCECSQMDRVDLEAQSENIDLENAVNVDTKLDEDVIELGGSDIDKSLKKKRLKSKVWEFFDVLPLGPDKKLKSVCKKCGHQYLASSKYGTGNMLKHIKTCPRTETREIGQMLITRDSNSLSFGSSQFDSEKWRELVTTCIILHDLPFRFVEYKGVRAMLQYLLPSVDLVSRNTAKADTLKLYKREKVKVRNMLQTCPGRICLTSDLWTSLTTDGYLCLTAHYIDKNWKLHKKILNFCFMAPPHTGIALSEKIFSLLSDWGIEEKIFSITLDNAASNDVSVDALQLEMNLRGLLPYNGEFFHLRCCAHILNLIVQNGLKSIDKAVGKIRDSVKYVKGSQQRKQKFLECVKLVSMGSTRGLSQDVTTRWNSTYLMLESAIFYQRAFQHLELSDSNYKHCLSTEEWERVHKIWKFLKGFYKATLIFSGTKYPTANLYFPAIFDCYITLKATMESGDEHLKCMALDMWSKFQKYWSEFSPVLGIALVLDPRYKLEFVAFCYDKAYGKNSSELFSLRTKLEALFEEYKLKLVDGANVTPASRNKNDKGKAMQQTMDVDESDLFKEFDDVSSDSFSSANNKSELDFFLDEPRMRRSDDLDILSYWKTNQCRYPILAAIARDILSIPVSTVASEAAFSVGGRVLDQFRSSLKSDTVEAIICARDWLFGNEVGIKTVDKDMDDVIQDVVDLNIDEEKIVEQDSNSGCV